MGGRYLVTGVQLGVLLSSARRSLNTEITEIIEEIIAIQHIGASEKSVKADVKDIGEVWNNANV